MPVLHLSRHRAAFGLVACLALTAAAGLPQLAAQTGAPLLVVMTLNTGTVLIAEVTYENTQEVKAYNLDTGEEETFPKAKGYRKMTASEAKLLPARVAQTGKRPERLEVSSTWPLTSNSPDLFSRLGRYPENAGKYLAWAVNRAAKGSEPHTVAVLPILDTRREVTPEATRRAEELTGAMARRRVSMVERSRIDQVLGELTTQQDPVFDSELAQKLGKQVGATAVVVGSLSPRGTKADLNLRLVEVATGKILDAPTVADVPGLVTQRTVASRRRVPTLVGIWDVAFPDGKKGVLTFRADRTMLAQNGGRGRWEQNDLSVKIMTVPPNATKNSPIVTWVGEISADGQVFQVKGSNGLVATGERK